MKTSVVNEKHMDLVWKVVAKALEWHRARNGGGVLKRAATSADLDKVCLQLEEFETRDNPKVQ